jgi:hypothetical protein
MQQGACQGDRRRPRQSLKFGIIDAAAPSGPAAFLFFPPAFGPETRVLVRPVLFLKEEYLNGKTFRSPSPPRRIRCA